MASNTSGERMFLHDNKIRITLGVLKNHIYTQNIHLTDIRFKAGDIPGAEQPDYDDASWKKITPGFRWGKPNTIAWFRFPIRILDELHGKKVGLVVSSGGLGGGFHGECLAYIDGKPRQGIDKNHHELLLAPRARKGDTYVLALEAYTGMFQHDLTFEVAKLVEINQPVRRLYWDLFSLFNAVENMPANTMTRARSMTLIVDTLNILDFRFSDVPLEKAESNFARFPGSRSFQFSVIKAIEFLAGKKDKIVAGAKDREKITLSGHAHIDVAWRWPLAVTRKKCGRTFSTVIEYMKRFPEYHFFQSQPALYSFVREDYPDLYRKIKSRVKEGRWEANGATWVEMDTNVPSGESLVRQFLYGKRFFRKEFGYDSRVMWLPDVFGYSWSLPQIMKKSGVDYFITSKISWNQYNHLPFDVFNWKGVDGTSVLTRFITAGNPGNPDTTHVYNGMICAEHIKGAWTNLQGKQYTSESFVPFGHGDGGGGPTQEMLEQGMRLQNIKELPLAEFGRIDQLMDRTQKESDTFPEWNGELYFELHRKTYTSQARTKRMNRMCEIALHDLEFYASAAMMLGGAYPAAELNGFWETLLTHQFHDILPGSSVREVYEDAERDYADILRQAETVTNSAISTIAGEITAEEKSSCVFNSLSWERSGIVEIDNLDLEMEDDDGICPSQVVEKASGGKRKLITVQDIPADGYKVFATTGGHAPQKTSLKITSRKLENRFFVVKLDRNGDIRSLIDKTVGREVVAPGARLNQMILFEDRPANWDAWDMDIFYNEKPYPVNGLKTAPEIIETGPVRGGIKLCRSFGRSSMVQHLYLYDRIPRIDFVTDVDWQEKKMLLKAAFPVDIHSDTAAYEIQYGTINRSTHWNTSWDWARFEACGHKWVDLSESDYGVSLLNTGKYGYDIKNNCMRITLLAGPTDPDPDADTGQQQFSYALYPHQGTWEDAQTVRAGYEFNYPMRTVMVSSNKGRLDNAFTLVSVDRPDVIVDTVKKHEDRKEIVFRLYMSRKSRGECLITFTGEPVKVHEINLLEENIRDVPLKDNRITAYFKPFEIKTFSVKYR